jgi:hypothetical protein
MVLRPESLCVAGSYNHCLSIKHWAGLAPLVRRLRRENTYSRIDPANRIFVWGQRPDIYLDAHRRPACATSTFPLTGYVFGDKSRLILAAGSSAPGPFWSKILPRIPDLHCRCSARPEVRTSSEGLSDLARLWRNGTAGGALPKA